MIAAATMIVDTNAEIAMTGVIAETVAIVKCMMQLVQNVVSHARYHSNQLKADQFTAEIVTNQNHDSKIHFRKN
jgi:hypothetical protein